MLVREKEMRCRRGWRVGRKRVGARAVRADVESKELRMEFPAQIAIELEKDVAYCMLSTWVATATTCINASLERAGNTCFRRGSGQRPTVASGAAATSSARGSASAAAEALVDMLSALLSFLSAWKSEVVFHGSGSFSFQETSLRCKTGALQSRATRGR